MTTSFKKWLQLREGTDFSKTYEKGVTHTFSGSRVKRGLYRLADGRVLNADGNGSANIGRKVIRDSEIIARLDRSVAATPELVNPLKFFCGRRMGCLG